MLLFLFSARFFIFFISVLLLFPQRSILLLLVLAHYQVLLCKKRFYTFLVPFSRSNFFGFLKTELVATVDTLENAALCFVCILLALCFQQLFYRSYFWEKQGFFLHQATVFLLILEHFYLLLSSFLHQKI